MQPNEELYYLEVLSNVGANYGWLYRDEKAMLRKINKLPSTSKYRVYKCNPQWEQYKMMYSEEPDGQNNS